MSTREDAGTPSTVGACPGRNRMPAKRAPGRHCSGTAVRVRTGEDQRRRSRRCRCTRREGRDRCIARPARRTALPTCRPRGAPDRAAHATPGIRTRRSWQKANHIVTFFDRKRRARDINTDDARQACPRRRQRWPSRWPPCRRPPRCRRCARRRTSRVWATASRPGTSRRRRATSYPAVLQTMLGSRRAGEELRRTRARRCCRWVTCPT